MTSGTGPHATEVVAIFGPTGIGKTAVAVALGERLRARGERPVAISADALQVYAGLSTLTGVASAAERERLPHRLVGFVPIDERFSAGVFAARAHEEIDGAISEGRRPIVVGGTGLYLQAALTDLQLPPAPPAELRRRLEQRLTDEGPERLHAELAAAVPETAARIQPADRRRVVRALELLATGDLRDPAEPDRLWTAEMRRPTLLAGLTMDREALYARIEARVRRMVAAGAVEEVRAAAAAGASPTARAALGFQELLAGDVDAMIRRTRQYAKRQLTWMRKLAGVHVIDVTARGPADVAAELLARLDGDGSPAGGRP